MGYERQKTWEAVGSLISERPVRERLAHAGMPLATLEAHLRHAKLPELSSKVDRVLSELTQGRTVDLERGSAALSEEDAKRIADEILSLMVDAFGGL